jgi:hypothetical protein
MPNPWTAVDDLIHELGSVRAAARELSANAEAAAALEHAIREAADAVDFTIDAPTDPGRLLAAREALGVAEELILALDVQLARGLRARNRSEELRARAQALLKQSREAQSR